MSSDHERRSSETRCPDFNTVATGVGILPVPSGLAAQMHVLYHNTLTDVDCKSLRASGKPIYRERYHPPEKKPSKGPPSADRRPLPPPRDQYPDLIKQWERLLAWATFKTLTDFKVMPGRPAREASRRVAKRILADYGPALHNWLGTRTSKTTTSGGKRD